MNLELYHQSSRVQTNDNQEAWSVNTVQVLNEVGVSDKGANPKTEGKSGYQGRDKQTWSGVEGKFRYQEIYLEKGAGE